MATELVDIMPVHGHDEISECLLIHDPGDSGILPLHVGYIILGRKMQVTFPAVFGVDDGFKAVTKIKAFTKGRLLP